jgi:hypothetical protein
MAMSLQISDWFPLLVRLSTIRHLGSLWEDQVHGQSTARSFLGVTCRTNSRSNSNYCARRSDLTAVSFSDANSRPDLPPSCCNDLTRAIISLLLDILYCRATQLVKRQLPLVTLKASLFLADSPPLQIRRHPAYFHATKARTFQAVSQGAT